MTADARQVTTADLEGMRLSIRAKYPHSYRAIVDAVFEELTFFVRAGGVEQPETEQFVIEQVMAHWFTQGGEVQFGELPECHNADEVVAAILSLVRRRIDRDLPTANDVRGILKPAGGVERTPAKETENESAISTQDAIRNESDERLAGSGRPHQQVGGAERRQRREQDHRADQDRGVASAQEVARGAVEPPAQEPSGECEAHVIAEVLSHWFTQGGEAQFGALLFGEGRDPGNADEFVSALLARLRSARSSPPPAELVPCKACADSPIAGTVFIKQSIDDGMGTETECSVCKGTGYVSPPPATPQEWQPIATAPKDGTPVLVWSSDVGGEGFKPFAMVCGYHPDAGFCTHELMVATHWMPLPAAPHGADTPGQETK